jgi:hypothetical protein
MLENHDLPFSIFQKWKMLNLNRGFKRGGTWEWGIWEKVGDACG